MPILCEDSLTIIGKSSFSALIDIIEKQRKKNNITPIIIVFFLIIPMILNLFKNVRYEIYEILNIFCIEF
ncbi:MAG: hypothetical protein BAJALOKI1v1_880001 [Promethearchaeota archaeon]|nr:MAG: hypothetical protein BAJALOKI1v1_880001 [Candidatus Lokiarchaeota archaeon]